LRGIGNSESLLRRAFSLSGSRCKSRDRQGRPIRVCQPHCAERFRPNLVVECGAETGFVENSWVGRTVGIGPELMLRVSIPFPRCVMATLPRGDLPSDPALIRLIARMNTMDLGEIGRLPCAGVYADTRRSRTPHRLKVQVRPCRDLPGTFGFRYTLMSPLPICLHENCDT